MSIYRFILPSGTTYDHEFKSSTTFRSAKLSLAQSKKVVGTPETIRLIANHQYVLDTTKLDILSRSLNKNIYVEHNAKSFAILIRFLKDDSRSFSALFARNETILDIKKYLAGNQFLSETNNDPSKIQLAKGQQTFSDETTVENLNIRKHDCLVVTIGENETPQKTLLEEPIFRPDQNELHVTFNPKKAQKNKIISNDFMHCQVIRASFPDKAPKGEQKQRIPNAKDPLQFAKAPEQKKKPMLPRSKVQQKEKRPVPPLEPTKIAQPDKMQKKKLPSTKLEKPSPRANKSSGKSSILSNNSNKSSNSNQSTNSNRSSNSNRRNSSDATNLKENMKEKSIRRNKKDAQDEESLPPIIPNEETKESPPESIFSFDDGVDEEEDNEMGELEETAIKLPLPFQLPNGSVQSILLSANDTLGDVKKRFSEICNCDPSNIVFNLKGKELSDDSAQVMSISEYHGTTPIMIVVHVNESKPGDDKIQYFFRLADDRLIPFYFEENATIKDARNAIAKEFNIEPSDITLIYNCKNLSDKILLRKLRIPVDGCIIALMADHTNIRIKTPLTVMKPRKPFSIRFLTNERQFDLPVPPLDSVEDVKKKLEKKLNCQADQIDFIFGGKLLTNDLIFDGLGVHDGSKIVVNLIRPTTACLSKSLGSSTIQALTQEDPEGNNGEIDSWEDELFEMISAKELIHLQALPPKEMSDAEKIIIYLRCNRNLATTRRTLKNARH